PGYLYGHFSDYSVNQMRNYMESSLVKYDATAGEYRRWSNTTNSYSTTMANNGVTYPLQRDVQVISVMAGASSVTASTNIVYPPIGAYQGNLIRIFDATNSTDRTSASSLYCNATFNCDYTLRVVQGGVTKNLILPIGFDPAIVDPTDAATFDTRAINLPASDGAVTSIQLLSTPNIDDAASFPGSPTVLASWP
ncbi:MAG TPA: hypothetical protein DDZ41_09380, partial [Flavobacterium sp.]|nr:hypothetical protein [Flavobacterium sp.]